MSTTPGMAFDGYNAPPVGPSGSTRPGSTVDGLDRAANLFAGIGDALTNGLTQRIRRNVSIGGNSIDSGIDPNSGAYNEGGQVGTALGLAVGLANPCNLGGVAGTGLRILNGLQGAGSLGNAGENIQKGDYGAAAFDVLDAAMSAMDLSGSCFGAGTPILTPEGSKWIEEFRRGDLVLSRPEDDLDGPVVARVVEEVFVRLAEMWDLNVGGRTIWTTAEHPFWVEGRGWTGAARLVEGDRLATLEGGWAVVGGMSTTGELVAVYNMRVAGFHTYFVGSPTWECQIWSHNSRCPVIGRRPDTAVVRRTTDHRILEVTDGVYSRAGKTINRKYIQSAIDKRERVYLASPRTPENLINPETGRPTVFAQELEQLEAAGYKEVGDYMVPPDAP